jgi:hypothetical protein
VSSVWRVCEQLPERVGLGQVVVGTGIESLDAILDGIERGQHEDRRGGIAAPEIPAHVDALLAGQEPVQDDQVVVGGPQSLFSLAAVGGKIDREPFFLEAPAQDQRTLAVVFDEQDSHVGSLRAYFNSAFRPA